MQHAKIMTVMSKTSSCGVPNRWVPTRCRSCWWNHPGAPAGPGARSPVSSPYIRLGRPSSSLLTASSSQSAMPVPWRWMGGRAILGPSWWAKEKRRGVWMEEVSRTRTGMTWSRHRQELTPVSGGALDNLSSYLGIQDLWKEQGDLLESCLDVMELSCSGRLPGAQCDVGRGPFDVHLLQQWPINWSLLKLMQDVIAVAQKCTAWQSTDYVVHSRARGIRSSTIDAD